MMIIKKILPKQVVCKLTEWNIGLLVHEFLFQIPYIIYFNFRYLPWNQATRLPIWLHVRSLHPPKGRIVIESETIKPGMIILGPKQYFYHKKGIYLMSEGTIVFRGNCWISNATRIDVEKNARLVFGRNTGISTSKISCAKSIEFGKNVIVGMDCSIMDSDFHPIIDLIGRVYINPTIPVKIGDYNWLGAETMVMKGTKTPRFVIVGARSVLNKNYRISECSILQASNGTEFINEGYVFDWRKSNDCLSSRKIEDIEKVKRELGIN